MLRARELLQGGAMMKPALSACLLMLACSDSQVTTALETPPNNPGNSTQAPGAGSSGTSGSSGGSTNGKDAGATGPGTGGMGDSGIMQGSSDASAPGPAKAFDAKTTWHLDIENPVDTSVNADAFDIDLFDNVTTATIADLHARSRKVVCYFSAGSSEAARPDFAMLPKESVGKKMVGWPENWLDHRHAGVRAVMASRIALAKRIGCDGIDPDNVDGYSNDSGFPLTEKDQLDFNRFLAREAHAQGLAVGLKNDLGQVPDLVSDFDFAINEQCFAYNECAIIDRFIMAGKSVANIEYGNVASNQKAVCPSANARSFFTILSEKDRIDGTYTRCRP
jgi:Glycoside-hydrolase family GH114